jgi:hypothetical protein
MSLFSRDNGDVKVIDKIWKNKTGKYKGCLQSLENNAAIIFVVWFEDTRKELIKSISTSTEDGNNVQLYKYVTATNTRDRQIIFAEHFPLRNKEQELFKKLSLKTATVYSSLDETLFTAFGGLRIAAIMEQTGISDDEAFEHILISRAIINMQKKIEEKIIVEQSAANMEEWMKRNYVV